MVGVQCRGPRGFIYCVLLSMWATGDQQQIPSNIRDVKAYPEIERDRREGTGVLQKRAGREAGGEKAGRVERGGGTDLILKEQKPLLIRPQMTSSHCIAKGGGEEDDDQREAKEEWTQGQKERKKERKKESEGERPRGFFSFFLFFFFCFFLFFVSSSPQPTANSQQQQQQPATQTEKTTEDSQKTRAGERERMGGIPPKKERAER